MDITDLIPEFNQYTLLQKKLFLDWIELPLENDEEARNRFLDSLNNSNDSNPEGEFNEIEINERLDVLMKRIQKKEKKDPMKNPIAGPGDTVNISSEARCKINCQNFRNQSQYQECVKNCKKN